MMEEKMSNHEFHRRILTKEWAGSYHPCMDNTWENKDCGRGMVSIADYLNNKGLSMSIILHLLHDIYCICETEYDTSIYAKSISEGE